ncbi:hypothetical protein SVIOM74S_08332 [Streptomyces violarus]
MKGPCTRSRVSGCGAAGGDSGQDQATGGVSVAPSRNRGWKRWGPWAAELAANSSYTAGATTTWMPPGTGGTSGGGAGRSQKVTVRDGGSTSPVRTSGRPRRTATRTGRT